MIFKGERNGVTHIEMIRNDTKTQTRRPSDRYQVGKSYAVQPGRGKKGIPGLRILIKNKWVEFKSSHVILREYAEAEGDYTQDEFEQLYETMYPGWVSRWAYQFKAVIEKIILTEEDLAELKRIHQTAKRTPMLSYGPSDTATDAWESLRRKVNELGKKYGFAPNVSTINLWTGEVEGLKNGEVKE